MNLSRRNKIIIGIFGAVLLLIVLFWWWFASRSQEPIDQITESEDFLNQLPVSGPPIVSDEPAAVVERPDLQATIKAIALSFAERFGSYSNESNFRNIIDLEDLMTEKMKTWAETFIATQRANQTTDFYGITTKAVSVQIVSFDEQLYRADVVVMTQRQELKNDVGNPKVSYQTLRLKLVQSDAGWKVDEATWQ